MTPRIRHLALALAALGLPPPAGMLTPLLGARAGLPRIGCVALALLALSALLHELASRRPPGPPPRLRACRLETIVREPRPGRLALPDGTALRVAQDLAAPAPGQPVEVTARVDRLGRPAVVAWRATGPPSGALLERWRRRARERVDALVHGPAEGLVAALLLADRRDLPAPLWWQARRAGTVHLLALSGLHVGLAAWVLGRLLAWSGLAGEAAPSLALAAFVSLAGSGPALCRAAIGWCLLAWGSRAGRSSSAWDRWLVSAVLLLAWQPRLALDLGTRLSFVAVAGMLAMPGPRGLAPLGAVLATAPLCVDAFGEWSWIGVLLTPVLLPCVATILVVGLVLVLPGEALSILDVPGALLLQGAADLYLAAHERLAPVLPEPLRPAPLDLPPLVASSLVVAALARLRSDRHPDPSTAET